MTDMKSNVESKVGLFFALGMIAAFLLLETTSNSLSLGSAKTVRTRFSDVQQLKEGDPVKMAGVAVGRVASIKLDKGEAEVELSLEPAAEVRTDSEASIRFMGLMGQNFIALSFGSESAPMADEGTLIESREQPDLSELMVKLNGVADGIGEVTKTFGTDNLSGLLAPFTDFLEQNRPQLDSILENTRQVTTQIANGEGTLGRLVQEDVLHTQAVDAMSNFSATATHATEVLNRSKLVFDRLERGEGTLGKLVYDDTLYQEGTVAMQNLREVLQKINRGEGSIGKLVNDNSLYMNARLTLQKVDKATETLEDQGPLSVLGIAINSLF